MKKVKWLKPKDKAAPIIRYSWVENPAMDAGLIFFSKQNEPLLFFNNEQRLVYSPLIVAEKEIPRVDKDGKPYLGIYPKETVRELHKSFAIHKSKPSTLEHNDNLTLNGDHLIEMWVVENEQDKTYTALNFTTEQVPVGSLMAGWYIENEGLWNAIKSGKINGPSIEVHLDEQIINFSNNMKHQFKQALQAFSDAVTQIFEDDKKKEYAAVMVEGSDAPVYVSEVAVGNVVTADEAGEQPLTDSALELTLMDGRVLVLDANSAIVEIREAANVEVEELQAAFSKQIELTTKLATELKSVKENFSKLQAKVEKLENKPADKSATKKFSSEQPHEGPMPAWKQKLEAHKNVNKFKK